MSDCRMSKVVVSAGAKVCGTLVPCFKVDVFAVQSVEAIGSPVDVMLIGGDSVEEVPFASDPVGL